MGVYANWSQAQTSSWGNVGSLGRSPYLSTGTPPQVALYGNAGQYNRGIATPSGSMYSALAAQLQGQYTPQPPTPATPAGPAPARTPVSAPQPQNRGFNFRLATQAASAAPAAANARTLGTASTTPRPVTPWQSYMGKTSSSQPSQYSRALKMRGM